MRRLAPLGATLILCLLALVLPAGAVISTSANKVIVSGNGSQTIFSYSFVADAASDINVIYTDASGNETTLTQGPGPTQFQVTVNSPAYPALWGVGGTVTYNPSGTPIASGTTLTIYRNLPFTQSTSLQNQASFGQLAKSTEQGLDVLEMQIQQIAEAQTRVISAPIVDPSTINLALPSAAQRANAALCFDGSGNVQACSTLPSGSVSSAMQPVVNSASLAGGRTAFGLGSMATENINSGTCGGATLQDDGSGNARVVNTPVSDATSQTVACTFHLTQRIATGPLTYTLPAANSLFPGFGFWINVLPGTSGATLAPNASDLIYGNSSGTAVTLLPGITYFVTTDGATFGTWYVWQSSFGVGAHLVIDPRWWGAKGDGTSDDTAAVQAAINFLTGGGTVQLSAGTFCIKSGPLTVTVAGVTLLGTNRLATTLSACGANVGIIAMSGIHDEIVNLGVLGSLTVNTAHDAIRFSSGCFECTVSNSEIHYGRYGINAAGSGEIYLFNNKLQWFYGSAAIYVEAAGGYIWRNKLDQPYPYATPSAGITVSPWAGLTSYAAGVIVSNGTYLLQATQGGVSGSVAPSNPAFGSTVTDGTVKWGLIGQTVYYGIQVDTSGGNALIIGLNDLSSSFTHGLAFTNSLAGTAPALIDVYGNTFAAQLVANIAIAAGWDITIEHNQMGGCQEASCTILNIENGTIGDVRIDGNIIYGTTGGTGIFLGGGVGTIITGNIIGATTTAVSVAAGVSAFNIESNQLGENAVWGANTNSVFIATGSSDHYNVTGNIVYPATGVSDGGTGTHKTISGNN